MEGEVEAADVGEMARGEMAEGVEGGEEVGGRWGGGFLGLGVDGLDCGVVAENIPEEFEGGYDGEVVWGKDAGEVEEEGEAGDVEGIDGLEGGGAVDVAGG